jgi:hypothetical protein
VLEPGGGLKSNADEMLAFMKAQLAPPGGLRDAIALTQQSRREAGDGVARAPRLAFFRPRGVAQRRDGRLREAYSGLTPRL